MICTVHNQFGHLLASGRASGYVTGGKLKVSGVIPVRLYGRAVRIYLLDDCGQFGAEIDGSQLDNQNLAAGDTLHIKWELDIESAY